MNAPFRLGGILIVLALVLRAGAESGPTAEAVQRLQRQLGGARGLKGAPSPALEPAPVRDTRAEALAARLAARGVRHARPAVPDAAGAGGGGPRAGVRRLLGSGLPELEVHLRPENGTIRQWRGAPLARAAGGMAKATPAERHAATSAGFLRRWADALGVGDPDAEFALQTVRPDGLGGQVLRYHQYWQGRRVWPGTLAVHLDVAGDVVLLEGAYSPSPVGVDEAPRIGAEEATLRARASVPGGMRGEAGRAESVVHAPLGAEPRLAWRFALNVGFVQAWEFVVDAGDGRILQRSNRILDANVTGRGVDLDGTSRALNVWQAGNTHYLVDTSKPMFRAGTDPIQKPAGVITIADAQLKKVQELQSSDVVHIMSGNPNAWTLPDGVSAAYHFAETYEYFLKEHGRDSLDGAGGNITAIVRVGDYDNASWNGNLKIMLFGNVKPYAGALDVVGHELTHGLTESSAGLVYENQSGAMNEAFSDVFGEMVEARVTGQPDWKMGTRLGQAFRDFQRPGSLVIAGLNRPYPARMSEFVQLPNTDEADHGGVHINSSIINHGFWQLAEGLPGAIGRRDAERIFYRTLTQHLQPQSQFVDARLGAVASAEALFGRDSTQARKTAEAFDLIEVFAAPETPAPPTVPVVQAPDSTLFIAADPFFGEAALYRRETALGDADFGADFATGVRVSRPAVTGDGSTVLYVDALQDLCLAETSDAASGGCLGFAGQVQAVAISPDGRYGAFILLDPATGQPDNRISIVDLITSQSQTYELLAPALDGVPVDAILHADAMSFSTDGQVLYYDAVSQLRFGAGPTVRRSSIYALAPATGRISIVVPPIEGLDTGNPSPGRAGNRYLAFDAYVEATGNTSVVTLDLFTGEVAEVGVVQGGLGFPAFTGDEAAVVYAQRDFQAATTGFSLLRQALTPDRLGTQGNPTLWMEDAALGVLYRRGTFAGTNALPDVTMTVAGGGTGLPPGVPVTLSATASDRDGSVARVEFYDGEVRIGEDAAPPFAVAWTPTVVGAHRLVARAVDNLGGVGDSIPQVVSVGTANPGTPPTLAIVDLGNGTLRIVVRGSPGPCTIGSSMDLREWTEGPVLEIGAGGEASLTEPVATTGTGVPARFFRARR